MKNTYSVAKSQANFTRILKEAETECAFAERRSIVYEIFAEALREGLAKER